jgi:hypothetical protein
MNLKRKLRYRRKLERMGQFHHPWNRTIKSFEFIPIGMSVLMETRVNADGTYSHIYNC